MLHVPKKADVLQPLCQICGFSLYSLLHSATTDSHSVCHAGIWSDVSIMLSKSVTASVFDFLQHLLDFAAGGAGAAPAATNDPWNPVPTVTTTVDSGDAWLTQPSASAALGGPSPFSPVSSATASNDPWGASVAAPAPRSEERRVGQECRSRWSPEP